jgi:hypothetical protein
MLFLLDLDGTLIRDRGYRAAIDATVIGYSQQHHLSVYPPSDDDIYLLHAHGYSNEWDTVAFLAGILHHAQNTGLSGRPDYQAWTLKTDLYDGLPNERACSALLHESPVELHPLLHTLLDNVTDVANTPTTRYFAELILGSELFTLHYGLPALLNTSALLEQLDEPLINAHSREILLRQQACIFTARPSLPPGHRLAPRDPEHPTSWSFTRPPADACTPVHPPEAEIGLRLLGLEHLPMIALGHIQWLADCYGERVYDLTKPNPVQALAAMLTARGTPERPSLHAAYDFWKTGLLPKPFTALQGERVYVLEDNATGIRSCIQAGQLLRQQGINVAVHGIGVTSAPAKQAVLQPVCDCVYDDANQALRELEINGLV